MYLLLNHINGVLKQKMNYLLEFNNFTLNFLNMNENNKVKMVNKKRMLIYNYSFLKYIIVIIYMSYYLFVKFLFYFIFYFLHSN